MYNENIGERFEETVNDIYTPWGQSKDCDQDEQESKKDQEEQE